MKENKNFYLGMACTLVIGLIFSFWTLFLTANTSTSKAKDTEWTEEIVKALVIQSLTENNKTTSGTQTTPPATRETETATTDTHR